MPTIPVPVCYGWHIKLPTIDVETYSEAGYRFDPAAGRWREPDGCTATKRGIRAVGGYAYARHPSTEVLLLRYDLQDGRGVRAWQQGEPCPADLAAHVQRGGLLEAHNASFEREIWQHVLHARHGWPAVRPAQWRCSAAKARAYNLPPALGKAAAALGLPVQKDPDGERLIKKFSIPRNPTKSNPALRTWLADDPADAARFGGYCDTDVAAEQYLSAAVPDLSPAELELWQLDQECNAAGIGVDLPAVRDGVAIIRQALAAADAECMRLTGGIGTSQVQALVGWLRGRGVLAVTLDADSLDDLLARDDLPADARRVLELRQRSASASVKKYFAMQSVADGGDRLRGLFTWRGAQTGRDTHQDVQPGNLPKAGPALRWCESDGCRRPYGQQLDNCPWCGTSAAFSRSEGWSAEAVDHAVELMRHRSAHLLEAVFGDPLLVLSGCCRGMLTAAPRHDLICSDYSSIEAVVIAELAGEQWRVDAFRRREDIYYHGASGVTGISYAEYKQWERDHGHKHPDRQKIGKPAELGLGFGGWVGALQAFGAQGTEQELRDIVTRWRAASPAIVELWGGQYRGAPWAPTSQELYGLEGMAIAACLSPGTEYRYRAITFRRIGDVLVMTLPSGRHVPYHRPRLRYGPPDRHPDWPPVYSLSYERWNTNPSAGAVGWTRVDIYGGKWAENATQAVANDIMWHGALNAHRAGYALRLRVHDELGVEVPEGWGSVEEFEQIIGTMPAWAEGWPIRAAGGWRGKRYRKD